MADGARGQPCSSWSRWRAGAAVWFGTTAEPRLRRDLERWLSDRLNSDVSIGTLSVSLFPSLRLEGTNLVLRIKGRPDLSPFITIRKWVGHRRHHRALDEAVDTWCGSRAPKSSCRPDGSRTCGRCASTATTTPAPGEPSGRSAPSGPLVDRLVADQVLITVQPRYADRDPVVWDVRDLVMHDFSLDAESPFSATVDTPLPRDRAHASGTAGPWPREDLETLPLQGQYTFDGDLGAVPGLDGLVHVEGNALGTLERLETSGTASSHALGLSRPRHRPAAADGHLSGDLRRHVGRPRADAAHLDHRRVDLRNLGQRAAPARRARPPRVAEGDHARAGGPRRRDAPARRRPALAAGRPAGTACGARPAGRRGRRPGSAHRGRVLRCRPGSVRQPRRPGPDRRPVTARPGAPDGHDHRRRGRATCRAGWYCAGAIWRCTRCGSRCRGRRSTPRVAMDWPASSSTSTASPGSTPACRRPRPGARRVLMKPIDPLLSKDGAGTRLVVDIVGTRDGPEGGRGSRRVAARPAVSSEGVESRAWSGGNGVDDGIRTRDSRSHSPELYH